jgi:CubicO group peptidase (beta-lactamase class C family)
MPPRKFVRPDDGQHPFSRFSVEDAHRFLKEVKLESPPGSRFRYSNFGYALLGHCIELATGSTYTQLLKDRICEPLGLRDTSIDLDSEQRKRFCHGYSARLAPKTHRRLEFMAPAGGIRSAAGDLAKFFNEAVLGKGPQSARLRACMTIRKKWPKDFIPKVRKDPGFQDLQAAGVGLGWLIYKLGRKTIVWHSGGTRGFSCFVGVERNTKTGIVFLTNSNGEITETGMRALLRITR